MTKTCVIYVRVSSTKQAEKELPIESQIDKCKQHAESLPAKIVKVYADEGISGRSADNRPAFQQAIAYCENFDVDYFVVWSTSRFARNALEAKLNKRRLAKSNTKISYVSVSIDEGDSGFIYEGILELFDEFYSRQISQDTLRSLINNAQRGYFNGGAVTVGFKAVPAPDNPKKKRILVAEPFEVETIKRAFMLKVSGHGAKQIAAILNEEARLNRGKNWHKGTVLAMLRNERYIGQVAFGKKTKEGARPKSEWMIIDSHEPLIDRELYDKVQEIMDSESHKNVAEHGSPKSTRFFTGLLKCHKCGSSMAIERAKGATKVYYYYNCKTKMHGKGCENRRINSNSFDPWLAEVICKEILNENNLKGILTQLNEVCGQWVVEKRKRMQEIEKDIRTFENRNSRLYELLENSEEGFNLQDVGPRLRVNNEKIRSLNTQLKLVEMEDAPDHSITNNDLKVLSEVLIDIIKTTDNPIRVREFFKLFIESIDLRANEVSINYRPDVLVSASFPVVPSELNWLPSHTLLGTNSMPIMQIVLRLPKTFRLAA